MTVTCESCSMPMANADDHALGDPDSPYCRYCTDETGALQPFEERFSRMVQWSIRKDGLSQAEAEERTRAFMRTLPAWRNHPALAE
jgi:hypothetical protein